MTQHWNKTNRNEIMKLLAFFLLQELHQKLDNKSYFSQRNILEMPIFLDLFNESYDEATCSSKYCINSNPYWITYMPNLGVYIPSKRVRSDIKSFELREAKSGYVWNFIIYI
jgi:hypothetical protein